MTISDDLTDVLEDHPAFEETGAGHRLTTLQVEGIVRVVDRTLLVEVELPTLETVVRDAVVPDVVAAEWFETVSRRLEEGYDVARSPPADPVRVERDPRRVVVRYRIDPEDAEVAVADAKALAEYAQGTYVQGAIPGYSYGSPLDELLSGAWDVGTD